MTSEDELDNDAFEDDEDEAAMARFREAEDRLFKTPPRCLNGFKIEPATLSGVAFDGHGSERKQKENRDASSLCSALEHTIRVEGAGRERHAR